MSPLVIDTNPITRSRVVAHDVGDELVLQHQADLTDIAEYTKEMRNQHDGRFKDEVMNLALTIPIPVMDDLHRRGILNDPDAFKKWRQSEEADPWRIYPGRDL